MRELVSEFVNYCTTPGDRTPAGLLRLCDRILGAIHDLPEEFDDVEYPDAPRDDYLLSRKLIGKVFPNLGFYNLPESVNFQIAESEIEVGDAIDDITDIVADFKDYLWRCEHTSKVEANWQLLLMFRCHWGRHMRDLQFCLERIDG
jgi:hypothetical protein